MSRAQKILNLCNHPLKETSLECNLDLNEVLHHLQPLANNQTQVCKIQQNETHNSLEFDLEHNDVQLQPLTTIETEMGLEHTDETNRLKTDFDSCKRRLFQDISNESAPEAKRPRLDQFNSCGTNVLKVTDDRHPEVIKKEIYRRLNVLQEMKYNNEKDGRRSAARRKQKKIKSLQKLIERLNKGERIEMSELTPVKEVSLTKENTKVPINVSEMSDSSFMSADNSVETVAPRPVEEDILNKGSHVQTIVTRPVDVEISNKGSSKSKPLKRKENYCIHCKKCVKEFCKHYENVHKNTPEGLKLHELNKINDKALRKKLKTEITDFLRKKGNSELTQLNSCDLVSRNEVDVVIPVKRSSKSAANGSNLVQCAHCKGYYRRRKFSQHLRLCKNFLQFNLTNGNHIQGCDALKKHCLPIIPTVEGASMQLLNEVIMNMKNRKTKDVAVKDSLIMKYASEFQKTRRAHFQKNYVSRVITDLARILIRMKEVVGEEINCLEDVFNPKYFSKLVECILAEGGYDHETGKVEKCGLANRLRSHIKGAAETAKRFASEVEHEEISSGKTSKRKVIKHFLELLKEKWANEVGRIFEESVKMSRSESEKKLALEEDIVKTCEYICSQYRTVITQVDSAPPGSACKQNRYNTLLDLLVTHIMCLIRRRPVDFKRGLNVHYQKIDEQEDLITEVKNSKQMDISEEDMKVCSQFTIFYVPGKGWKELVPIALTKVMKQAMDCIQRNKKDVGINSDILFIRAREMNVNPRECIKKVTRNLKLKKPLDMSGNGLRHHAATWSKLHSSHPQYQDYLASALGHSLHIHKLHYEMPTSILQKLIVCPVLHNMTKPKSNTNKGVEDNTDEDIDNPVAVNAYESDKEPSCMVEVDCHNQVDASEKQYNETQSYAVDFMETPEKDFTRPIYENKKTPEMEFVNTSSDSDSEHVPLKGKPIHRLRWTDEEKCIIYNAFGKNILEKSLVPRSDIVKMLKNHKNLFKSRSEDSVVTFVNNKILRKQKNVSPEVKSYLAKTHRKVTNVPI